MAAALDKPLVCGVKQTLRALRDGRAKAVYVALDASPCLTGPVRTAAQAAGIPVSDVPSMRELGRACGLKVGSACAAVLGRG